MIEELEGGTITTRHRYTVGPRRHAVGPASVHEGVQEPFDKPVWIHVYDLGEDHEHLEVRLIETAHQVASLGNPRALAALDHGQLDLGVPFVITARSDKPPLSTLLARVGTLSPAETAALIGAIAPAIDAAHDAGVAHGALSPRCVFTHDDDLDGAILGHVGSSLTLDELLDVDEDAPLQRNSLTPLPPEMFRGESPTHTPEGDLYALGALAYECLTGSHPFFPEDEDTDIGLLHIKSRHARPLDELGFDAPLSDLIAATIDPDPDARPARATELARELGVLTRELEPEPTGRSLDDIPTSSRDTHRSDDALHIGDLEGNAPDARGTVAALAILALLSTNVGWLLFSAPFAAEPTPAVTEPPPAPLSILPQGLQLDSEPQGASIHVVRDDGEDLLGKTPQIINPALPRNEPMRLRISADGHKPVLLDVERRADGQDVRLVLERAD